MPKSCLGSSWQARSLRQTSRKSLSSLVRRIVPHKPSKLSNSNDYTLDLTADLNGSLALDAGLVVRTTVPFSGFLTSKCYMAGNIRHRSHRPVILLAHPRR